MTCPRCGSETPDAGGRCYSCSSPPLSLASEVTVGVLASLREGYAEPVRPERAPKLSRTDAGFDLTPIRNVSPSFDADTIDSHSPASSGTMGSDTTGLPMSAGGVRRAGTSKPQQGPLVVGQKLTSRYQIVKLLGIGGMGAVYQAWDAELSVMVALKVIRRDVVEDSTAAPEIERRFKQELLLARQVTHKNVVRIHDLGEIDGIKYITMPYLEGADLATVLRQNGKLTASAVMPIARQMVAGLRAAHEAGVVHRDLKPANIMIEGERAIIMDFGIAHSASLAGTSATGQGMTVGQIGSAWEDAVTARHRGRRRNRHARVHGAGASERAADRSAGGHLRNRLDPVRHAARTASHGAVGRAHCRAHDPNGAAAPFAQVAGTRNPRSTGPIGRTVHPGGSDKALPDNERTGGRSRSARRERRTDSRQAHGRAATSGGGCVAAAGPFRRHPLVLASVQSLHLRTIR